MELEWDCIVQGPHIWLQFSISSVSDRILTERMLLRNCYCTHPESMEKKTSPHSVCSPFFLLLWRLLVGFIWAQTSLSLLSSAGLSFVHSLTPKGSSGRCPCLERVDRNSVRLVKLLTRSTTSRLKCTERAEVLRLIWQTWHSVYRRHMSTWRAARDQQQYCRTTAAASVSEDAAHT